VLLSADDQGNVEADAEFFRARFGGGSLFSLCVESTGHPPRFRAQPKEGCLDGGRIWLRARQSRQRARQALGHELAHVFYRLIGYDGPDIEERCDHFSACLCCERQAFRLAIKELGHSYKALAKRFDVTWSVAFLRLGEVTGRPVCLLCPSGPIFRGADFSWPSSISALVRAIHERRSEIHPATISDEPNRIGLMATHFAWSEMVA